MSELIKTYKPPRLNRWNLEKGVRYVETPPEHKLDWLGQELKVGDIAFYFRGSGYSAEGILVKVIGFYTTCVPSGEGKEPQITTTVSIAVGHAGYRWETNAKFKVRKQTTQATKLIKLHDSQYNTPKLRKELVEA